jgi:hypothetical protein
MGEMEFKGKFARSKKIGTKKLTKKMKIKASMGDSKVEK